MRWHDRSRSDGARGTARRTALLHAMTQRCSSSPKHVLDGQTGTMVAALRCQSVHPHKNSTPARKALPPVRACATQARSARALRQHRSSSACYRGRRRRAMVRTGVEFAVRLARHGLHLLDAPRCDARRLARCRKRVRHAVVCLASVCGARASPVVRAVRWSLRALRVRAGLTQAH